VVEERLIGKMRSSVFFVSPGGFATNGSSPSTPASEPRETPWAMALQERTTSLISIEKSPTSAGLRRCSSIRIY
jgi:hypothetical protein